MVSAGCAVPLVAGGLNWDGGAGGKRGERTAASDAVLDHARRELARGYHAMRGPAGIRGEHVRSLAANLDLIAACLESNGGAVRVDGELRQGLEQNGPEATALACAAAFGDVVAELRRQYAIEAPADGGTARPAPALDVLAARGALAELRGPRVALVRLAVQLDRREADRSPATRPIMAYQKPGDDFLGYPPGSVFYGLSLCQFIQACQFSLELLAGVLALTTGGPVAAGAVALAAVSLELLKLVACRQDVEV